MSRSQKLRSLVYGLGALGGTVAIFATVLEQLYGDPEKKNKLKSQLSTEKFAFFYLRFCFVVVGLTLFLKHIFYFSKKILKANFSILRSGNISVIVTDFYIVFCYGNTLAF